MQEHVKMAQKLPKLVHNGPKWPLFLSIQQYLTLFDFRKGIRFLYEINSLAFFDPIWLPNSKTITKYFE